MAAPVIRRVVPGDAAAIAAIYNHHVVNTIVTFEETPVDDAEMRRRIADIDASHAWFVAQDGARVAAYAYASAWRARSAYRRSVETTVYVASDAMGRGLGTKLYDALLRDGRDRAAERGKRRAARAHGLCEGRPLPRGGMEARALDRRRVLATHAVTGLS